MSENSAGEFRVVWPLGQIARREYLQIGDRPVDLDGKTVAFLWDYVFRGDEMFPVVERELRERFPSVRVLNYDVFGDIHGGHDDHDVLANVGKQLLEEKVSLAVVGVGA